MGRKQIKISWNVFENLCKIQCTQSEICSVLEVSEETLRTRLKEKYGSTFETASKQFSDGGKASLRRSQFEMAQRNPTMAIWLGKQYLGQSDKIEVGNDDFLNAYIEIMGKKDYKEGASRASKYLNVN